MQHLRYPAAPAASRRRSCDGESGRTNLVTAFCSAGACVVAILMCGDAAGIEIEQIRPNAWAATQPQERVFNDCNSLIVEADDFVVVIDAQAGQDDVQQIIAFAKDDIGKPVRYLINTHWHGDHTQGNTAYREAFGDELVIIGHSTHEQDILERAAKDLAEQLERTNEALPAAREQVSTGVAEDGSVLTGEELAALRARVERAEEWLRENRNAVFTGPSKSIDRAFALDAGVASFSIHPMRGHTRGDLVISFGELGLVATGDLVDAMPYSGHGYPKEWLNALKDIRLLGASTYLPGHGSLQNDDLLLMKLLTYFDSLTSQVAALRAAGKSPDEIRAAVDLSGSRDMLAGGDAAAGRFFDQVQDEAIERAILELD